MHVAIGHQLIEDILHQRRIRAGARRVAQGLRQAQLDMVFDIEVIRVGFGVHWGHHGARLLIHCNENSQGHGATASWRR